MVSQLQLQLTNLGNEYEHLVQRNEKLKQDLKQAIQVMLLNDAITECDSGFLQQAIQQITTTSHLVCDDLTMNLTECHHRPVPQKNSRLNTAAADSFSTTDHVSQLNKKMVANQIVNQGNSENNILRMDNLGKFRTTPIF